MSNNKLTNLAYTVIHIELGSSEYRNKNTLFIKEKLKDKMPYMNSETHRISNSYELNNYYRDHDKFNLLGKIKYGEIGCLASHYDSWVNLINSEYDSLIVIEDDALISDNFINNIYEYISDIPENFDVASLYVHPNRNQYYDSSLHNIGNKYICLGFQDRSTLAYIISKNGAKKYKNFADKLFDRPLDLFLFDKEKNTNFYSIHPEADPLFKCDLLDKDGEVIHSSTTIQNTPYVQ
jgi:GR25 family glycosyltransferase involved in LPS biosynthesis